MLGALTHRPRKKETGIVNESFSYEIFFAYFLGRWGFKGNSWKTFLYFSTKTRSGLTVLPWEPLLVVLQMRKLKPRAVMHCSQVHTAVARPPQVQNQSGSRAAVDGGKNTAGEGRLASAP